MFNDAATAKSSFRRSLFFRRVPNIGQDVHGRRVRNHFVIRNVYFVDFAFDVYDFGGFRWISWISWMSLFRQTQK